MPRLNAAIKPLYDRLKQEGFDRGYVQAAILPDWWDDSLYEQEQNRLLAHLSIAKFLGVKLSRVVDRSQPIVAPAHNVRLKRGKQTGTPSGCAGAIVAAMYAATTTAHLIQDRLPFTGLRPALEIRDLLLSRPECVWPDLENLLQYCWQHGIAVVHVTQLPSAPASKRIAGLATFVGDRPVIVLCSRRDSPAWLAFHLAHELGHIMCGHVKPGGDSIVDLKLEGQSNEAQEREADFYAFQVLTGEPEPNLSGQILNGEHLAKAAHEYGMKHRIDPGTVALIYGYSQKRLAAAQIALKALHADRGAGVVLAHAYRQHVPLDDLPEGIQRSLSAITQIYGLTPTEDDID